MCGDLRRVTAAEHDERRGSARERGYDYRWEKLRDWYRASHPLCEKCGRPMDHVDHIVPLRDGGERLDPDNLQSLCKPCHDKKTKEETRKRRAGEGG